MFSQQNRTQKLLRHFFLKRLQKYYELPILVTLDKSGHFHQKQETLQTSILRTLGVLDHPHQKSYYQFVGNFRTYLYPKNQLHYSLLSYDIAKNSELIMFNLVMSGHTHTK